MDETFVGGKITNMHKSKRPKGTGLSGQANGAMAKNMVERGGRVNAEVVQAKTHEVLCKLQYETFLKVLCSSQMNGRAATRPS